MWPLVRRAWIPHFWSPLPHVITHHFTQAIQGNTVMPGESSRHNETEMPTFSNAETETAGIGLLRVHNYRQGI